MSELDPSAQVEDLLAQVDALTAERDRLREESETLGSFAEYQGGLIDASVAREHALAARLAQAERVVEELRLYRRLEQQRFRLVEAAWTWRRRYVDVIDDTNSNLFQDEELALIRSVDSQPRTITMDGRLVDVELPKCDCRPCSARVLTAGHCVDIDGDYWHSCAAVDALDGTAGPGEEGSDGRE